MAHKLREFKLIQEDGNEELYFASLIHHATEFDMQEIVDHVTCPECMETVRLHNLWANISDDRMFWEDANED